MKRTSRGFTLIELMIVIAILGILIAIALPAYQDYSIRAKNSECLQIAAMPKLAMAENFQTSDNGATWPTSFTAAGYMPVDTSYCNAATYAGGGIFSIATANTGGPVTFTFTPSTTAASAVQWNCSIDQGANVSHAPAECR